MTPSVELEKVGAALVFAEPPEILESMGDDYVEVREALNFGGLSRALQHPRGEEIVRLILGNAIESGKWCTEKGKLRTLKQAEKQYAFNYMERQILAETNLPRLNSPKIRQRLEQLDEELNTLGGTLDRGMKVALDENLDALFDGETLQFALSSPYSS